MIHLKDSHISKNSNIQDISDIIDFNDNLDSINTSDDGSNKFELNHTQSYLEDTELDLLQTFPEIACRMLGEMGSGISFCDTKSYTIESILSNIDQEDP